MIFFNLSEKQSSLSSSFSRTFTCSSDQQETANAFSGRTSASILWGIPKEIVAPFELFVLSDKRRFLLFSRTFFLSASSTSEVSLILFLIVLMERLYF